MTQLAENNADGHDVGVLISQMKLFDDIGEALRSRFVEASQMRLVPKGKILYLQDDPADWFYLIVNGWIKLFRETLEGSEAIIDVLTEGHIFGENSVFEDDSYSYTVEVIENSLLVAFPTSLLKEAIASNNQLALNMLTSMSRHRLQQHREIEHLNVQNAPQRIGCFLLRLCRADVQGAVTLHLPYDKTLIAARLGMKPETFSRALAKLKESAKIRISGPTVYIDRVESLIEYTCNHCSTSFPCDDLK